MKKTISIFVLGLCVLGIMQSANAQYQKGDKLVNLGVGLGTYGGGGIGFGGSFEYGVHDMISAGVLAGYSGSSYGFSTTSFGVRGSFHFNELLKLGNDKIDLYAGAGLAYRSFNWGSAGSILGSSYGSGVFPLFHLGGKYYFTDKMAGYAELGSGFGLAQVGVAFKF